MPASGPPEEEKMFPSAVMEDQEAIMSGQMEPITLGMPPFSSPDPATDGILMVPLTEGEESSEMAAKLDQIPDDDKKAGDWVDVVKSASSHEALDQVEERYGDSEADFTSVDNAIEKRREELDKQAEEAAAEEEDTTDDEEEA